MIYYIEMPSGKNIPIEANDEEEAAENFKCKCPNKVICYVWYE